MQKYGKFLILRNLFSIFASIEEIKTLLKKINYYETI